MADNNRETVLAYIAAAQRARATRSAEDLSAVRALVADDIRIHLAAPWADESWGLALRGAHAFLERLQAPINAASSPTTENTTFLAEDDLVFVEQRSTLAPGRPAHQQRRRAPLPGDKRPSQLHLDVPERPQ